MRVVLRIEATPEQEKALAAEWLHGSGVLNIQTGDHDADMEVRVTYVKREVY